MHEKVQKMQKILCLLLFLTFGISANAQVENLDEVELLGNWAVVRGDGIFTGRLPIYNGAYKRPAAFTFNDNTESIVKWEYAGPDYSDEYYSDFWITHTSERYILHILSYQSYSGSTGLREMSALKFVVTRFENGEMTLQTLSGDGTMYLIKDTSSGVSAVGSNVARNNNAYTLNGMEAAPGTKGVIIQNGKKHISK